MPLNAQYSYVPCYMRGIPGTGLVFVTFRYVALSRITFPRKGAGQVETYTYKRRE
jgi:hypothetical protein